MAANKPKVIFICQSCGAHFNKWVGQCAECKAWNSVIEEVVVESSSRFANYFSDSTVQGLTNIVMLQDIELAA